MEFWRYYRIVRRRRWLILLGMAICIGVVSISNMKQKQEYTGRTTLMESKGSSEGVSLYPNPYTMPEDTQLRLSNLATYARSQPVMEAAADTLADLRIVKTPREILNATLIEPVKDTNILAIEVTLDDPDAAKIAADAIGAALKEEYARLTNPADTNRDFIKAQLSTARATMVEKQKALQEFKIKNNIVELNTQGQALVQRLVSAQASLLQATAAHDSALARMNKQAEELKVSPHLKDDYENVSKTTSISPEWQQLTQSLVQLESQKAGMLGGGRGKNHPEVLALVKQIADVRTRLGMEAKEKLAGDPPVVSRDILASSTSAKSSLRQNALDRYITAKVEEAGSQAQLVALNGEEDAIKKEWDKLPAQQAGVAEKEADVQLATDTYALMSKKYDEAKIKAQQVKNEPPLRTMDPAYSFPVNQKQMLKLILALLLSPLLGIGVAFMMYYLDNTIKTAPEAEKLLGMPVLSAVPESMAHAFARQRCSDMMDVAYQNLTSNLWIASQTSDVNGLVVVSAEPNVGRSVVASNLAIALAKEGARVILVDADLRQPTQHLMFGVDNKVGLTNVLAGGASLEDALIPTKIQGLLLVPTGPESDNPVKLLRSEAMKSIDDQIKSVADFVIYDTPAAVTFPDAVLVAAHVGAALVVHSTGRVPRGSETELRARLDSVGVKMLGAVLNKVKREDSSSYFHYRRSYEGIAVAQSPSGKKRAKG